MNTSRIKYVIVVIACCIGMTSCNTHTQEKLNETFVKEQDFKEIRTLRAEKVDVDSFLLRPIQIQVYDSVMLLMNSRADKMVHVFNLNNNKMISGHVSVGQGPDEMLIPRFSVVDSSRIVLSDLMSSTVQEYNMKDFIQTVEPVVKQRIKLSERAFGETRLVKDGYVAPARNGSFLMYKFDAKGIMVDSIGNYPTADWNPTEMEKIEMFTFSIATNSTNRIAAFYNWADIIDFYDNNGSLIKRVHGVANFISKYKEEHRGEVAVAMGVKGKTRDAYFSPQPVGDEVWVLFSGKSQNEDNYSILANTIYVYDWDGNPVRIFKLDQGVFSFSVDPRHRIIYGISDVPEFHILSYKY